MRNRRPHSQLLTMVLLFGVSAQVALSAPAISLAATTSVPTGVHIDPNSPVAKQYEIPLSTARGVPPGSSGSGALFGAGISSAGSRSAGSTSAGSTSAGSTSAGSKSAGSKSAGSKSAGSKSPGSTSAASTSGTGAPQVTSGHAGAASVTLASAPPAAEKVLHPGSSFGLVWMAGMAVLVLVIGGAGSLALTSRRRTTPRAG